jgi:hypothetical protein
MSENARSYAAEVVADDSGEWVGNGVRWPLTEAGRKAAESYVSNLAWRWTLVRDTRVVESPDDPSAVDAMLAPLQAPGTEAGTSNGWTRDGVNYFYERGNEQNDGSVTGSVWRLLPNDRCRKAGRVRVEPDGQVSLWATTTVTQREAATVIGRRKEAETDAYVRSKGGFV